MIFSKFTCSLYLLAFVVLFRHVVSQVRHYRLYHYCPSSNNFTSNIDIYERNLKNLTDYLTSKTPPSGFSLGSFGHDQDKVYGLALCRGDVLPSDCTNCMITANIEIHTFCPHQKNAIIWYERCLMKYSNEEFFGQVDYENLFPVKLMKNVSDPKVFTQKTIELLSQLANDAFHKEQMYATGKLELGGSNQLYGFVQCTKDLWEFDCKKCLNDTIALLPGCCEGNIGVQIVGGSCTLRYEIYPFLELVIN